MLPEGLPAWSDLPGVAGRPNRLLLVSTDHVRRQRQGSLGEPV